MRPWLNVKSRRRSRFLQGVWYNDPCLLRPHHLGRLNDSFESRQRGFLPGGEVPADVETLVNIPSMSYVRSMMEQRLRQV